MIAGRNGNCGEADYVAIALHRFADRFLSGFTAGINNDVGRQNLVILLGTKAPRSSSSTETEKNFPNHPYSMYNSPQLPL
jgi:hypothetical protein